jgi:adenylyltransferase/sulfurtransferase
MAGVLPAESLRYARHLSLPEFGEAGQRRLRDARVLVVGLGGLGSPVAIYLAAAGIGALHLVDHDAVDESNLQRQVIHATPDVGRAKIDSAAAKLRALNPDVHLDLTREAFDVSNARRLVEGCDVVVDGTDNFPTRYLVNDACVMTRRPNVYGSVARFEGQVSVLATPGGPCYRCLHPDPPAAGAIQNCAEAGVLGVLPGVVGLLQATETIKIVARIGEPLVGRLLLYDALKMRFREIVWPRAADCPVCGDAPSIRTLVRHEETCEAAAMSDAAAMTIDEYREWRRNARPHTLLDVREPSEHAVSRIDGSMLIPIDSLPERLDLLPRDRPIVVHCRTGRRSARAVTLLRARGLDARNLLGGLRAWEG